jgi:hypothetical protein
VGSSTTFKLMQGTDNTVLKGIIAGKIYLFFSHLWTKNPLTRQDSKSPIFGEANISDFEILYATAVNTFGETASGFCDVAKKTRTEADQRKDRGGTSSPIRNRSEEKTKKRGL